MKVKRKSKSIKRKLTDGQNTLTVTFRTKAAKTPMAHLNDNSSRQSVSVTCNDAVCPSLFCCGVLELIHLAQRHVTMSNHIHDAQHSDLQIVQVNIGKKLNQKLHRTRSRFGILGQYQTSTEKAPTHCHSNTVAKSQPNEKRPYSRIFQIEHYCQISVEITASLCEA